MITEECSEISVKFPDNPLAIEKRFKCKLLAIIAFQGSYLLFWYTVGVISKCILTRKLLLYCTVNAQFLQIDFHCCLECFLSKRFSSC